MMANVYLFSGYLREFFFKHGQHEAIRFRNLKLSNIM